MTTTKTDRPVPRCRACGGVAQKNYDHAGDCSTGRCTGTYTHARDATCPNARRDVRHRDVSDEQ